MDRVDEVLAAWRAEHPNALSPTSELSKRIQLLASDLGSATSRELAELELTSAEFGVIVALRRAGAPYRLKPNEVSRASFLSTGGTSNVINRLVSRGLIRRDDDPRDGRSRIIELTAEGKALAEKAVEANTAAHDEVFAEVPPEVVDKVAAALRELSAVIDRPRKSRRSPPN